MKRDANYDVTGGGCIEPNQLKEYTLKQTAWCY